MGKKVFNRSEVHLYQSNFLQNPYGNLTRTKNWIHHLALKTCNIKNGYHLKLHVAKFIHVIQGVGVCIFYYSITHPKTHKNHVKMFQNLYNIVAKIVKKTMSGRGLGSFWAALGELVCFSWHEGTCKPLPGWS